MDDVRYTLRQLEYFIAAAAEGSISGAAEQCAVSQTAVSLGISELERALGTQLVLRHRSKGIVLTSAGRQALIDALSLVRQAAQLQVGVREDDVTGRLAVGCYTTLSPILMPTLVRGFLREHPQVQIRMEENSQPELETDLLAGRLDLAVLYRSSGGHEGLDVVQLTCMTPHVVLPEDHRFADHEAVSLRDLEAEPMVLFDVPPSNEDWREMVGELGLNPVVAFRTKSFELTRCLVGQGFGYAVLVQRPRTSWTYNESRVVVRPIQEPVRPRAIVAVHPAGLRLPGKVRAFLEYCRLTVPGHLEPAPVET